MFNFVQSLESRTFLSASSITAAQLQADRSAVVSAGLVFKAAVTHLTTDVLQTNVPIITSFKALPKSDRFLLTALETAENKSKAEFLRDFVLLVNPAESLGARSVALGSGSLKKATLASLNVLEKEIILLGSATTLPANSLGTHLTDTSVADARTAITTQLAGDATLVSEVENQQSLADADKSSISATANSFTSAVAVLSADLTTLHSDLATFPALTATYIGTATFATGQDKGQTQAVSLVVNSEDQTNGDLTGTVTDLAAGGVGAFTGTVTLNGSVVLKSVQSNGAVTIRGIANLPGFTGKFSAPKASGTFSLVQEV